MNRSCALALLIILLNCSCVGTQSVTKVRFQEDEIASAESMLNIGTDAIPELTEITVCFHLYLIHTSLFNPVVSYFAENDNEFLIGFKWTDQFIQFDCCQFRVKITVYVPVRVRSWHHFCLSLNLNQRRYYLAYDDIFEDKPLLDVGPERLYITGGGRMVLGQDLDTLEGGFNMRQSLHGDVVNFQLFSKALGPSYLQMFVKCELPTDAEKPLLSFDKNLTEFEVLGSTASQQISLKDVCLENKETLVMLPEKRIFRTAFDSCKEMKSIMAVPDNDEKNTEIYDDVAMFNDQCVDAYGTIYWLGIEGDFLTGQWKHLSDSSEISYDNFAFGYEKVEDHKRCVTVGGKGYQYEWYNTDCGYFTCPLCNFTNNASFKVRGLCKDTLIDRFITISGYRNQKPHFRGISYTSMQWNNVSMAWVLSSRLDRELFGQMEMIMQDDYPVGVNMWNITGDKCTTNPVEILITACNTTEYTCSNGMCIRKDQRCDMIIDCPDKSDEFDCNIIIIPIGYSTELPPPKMGEEPLSIMFFMGITSVRDINILGFKMALDVILELRWIDQRLRMKNLRVNTKANKVQEPEAVWQPKMQVEDGSSSLADLMLRSKTLMVEKKSIPVFDDETRVHEDSIYLGSENTMYLYEVHTIGFTCQFHLQRYPFDKQLCSLTFVLVDVSSDFVTLTRNGIGVDFLGQKTLLEYEITTVTMALLNGTDDVFGLKVSLELRNLYGYYISNTYVPTGLLYVICYFTLYFDLDDFTDRIMVSLTSMLVLSSLFAQTSQSIPKTAYLKLIDLWFVVLIIFVFLIVLVLVVIENVRLKNQSCPRKVFVSVKPEKVGLPSSSPNYSGSSVMPSSFMGNPAMPNFWAMVMMPILFGTFVVSYSSACYAGL